MDALIYLRLVSSSGVPGIETQSVSAGIGIIGEIENCLPDGLERDFEKRIHFLGTVHSTQEAPRLRDGGPNRRVSLLMRVGDRVQMMAVSSSSLNVTPVSRSKRLRLAKL